MEEHQSAAPTGGARGTPRLTEERAGRAVCSPEGRMLAGQKASNAFCDLRPAQNTKT
ncbi:MAG: hypothetical protein ACI9Z9_000609, partial [Litorivivens sp.]